MPPIAVSSHFAAQGRICGGWAHAVGDRVHIAAPVFTHSSLARSGHGAAAAAVVAAHLEGRYSLVKQLAREGASRKAPKQNISPLSMKKTIFYKSLEAAGVLKPPEITET